MTESRFMAAWELEAKVRQEKAGRQDFRKEENKEKLHYFPILRKKFLTQKENKNQEMRFERYY